MEVIDPNKLPKSGPVFILNQVTPTPQPVPDAPRRKTFTRGDRFASCMFCEKIILWALDPASALAPYRCCNNECQGDAPKCIHEGCIKPFVVHPDNALQPGDEGITVKCSACNGSFDINLFRETTVLIKSIFSSRTFKLVLLLLLAFFAYGFVWKTWTFVYISMEWEPVDLINNERYIRFDKDRNKTFIDRPSLMSFYDWRTYNHCIITEWGKRRLLTTFDREIRGRASMMLPIRHEMNMMEIYGQLYSMLTDGTYGSRVDLTHYYSPCSDSGSLPLSWGGLLSHIAISLHAARVVLIVLLCGGALTLLDHISGAHVRRSIRNNSIKVAIYQGGVESVVRPVEMRGGARRRLIR